MLEALCDGLYRLALGAFPRRFRESFRTPMLQDFRSLARECTGRPLALLLLTLRESINVVLKGLGERRRGMGNRRLGPRPGPDRRFQSMIHDLRYAVRSLRRNAGLSVAVLLTLGLGIGVTSAVFSLVDHVLLRPLPYPDADRLVRVWGADRQSGQRFQELSFQDFESIAAQGKAFDALAAFSLASRRLESEAEHPSDVALARVTAGFMDLLGGRLELGRGFSPEEFRRQERVVILGHELWRTRFGGRTSAIGSSIDIRNEAHRIVGVLPAGWRYPSNADLYRPLSASEREDDDREFFVVARLAPGVAPEQASVRVAGIVERAADAKPDTRGRYSAWVQPLQAMLVRDVRAELLLMMAAVAVVLLVVCLNVANLLLARGITRRPEIALRSALGAARQRLMRLVVFESLLLAFCGGALGLGIGYLALQVLVAAAPQSIPRLEWVSLDARVAFSMGVAALLCGLAAGIIPAWLDSRPALRSLLADARGHFPAWSQARMRKGLAIGEVASATVLVIVAGLFSSSLGRMVDFDRGFSQRGLLQVELGPSQRVTQAPSESRLAFYQDLRDRLGSLPGVRSVSLSSFDPMKPGGFRVAPQIEGLRLPPGRRVQLRFVSADFLQEAGIPLLDGRPFDAARDNVDSLPVAIVNRAFAQDYLQGASFQGRSLSIPILERPLSVVGVASDLRPRIQSADAPAIYVPFEQMPWPRMRVLLGIQGDPAAAVPMIRESIWSIAPDVTLGTFQTLDQAVADTLAAPRFGAALAGVFAGLALILAAIGLYGMVSYSVSCQARELAIRRALGAAERGVFARVLGRGLGLVGVGVGLGIPIALGVGWTLSSELYAISPAAPGVYLLATLFLASAGLLACLIPALRAGRLDPASILKGQ